MIGKKLTKQTKGIVFLLVLMLLVFTGGKNAFAAEHNATDFSSLKNAVTNAENGDVINVNANITLTETLVIKDKNIKLSGNSLLINARDPLTNYADVKNIMFVIKDSTVNIDGLTLSGSEQNRIIYSENSTITLNNSSISNGCPGANSNINPGGGIFLRGGSLTATNTDFIGNTPGTNNDPTLKAGDRDLNGGAIYTGKTSANITINGGSFVDNEVKAYGHGAAIYQENGTLNITGTSFKNNKGHVEGGNAGTQGACIHTRDGVTATISGVTAEIAKGFNTGGFLRSWGSDVTVIDSTFTISGLGDGYGYSGGALCFENGTSKVTGSTFTCNGSKLFHAGGFIDIVGGGNHVIDGNNMTGRGKGNGTEIASFGGAISVEQGANATVTIKDNTISNSSASDNGGAIAIGTHLGKRTPSTITMSGNTISNCGTLIWGTQAGGALFVGPDAEVTMSGDKIENNRAASGGGVYNEGTLTINGGSSLTGGQGGKLGGEIYNNGTLTIDDATVNGGFVGFSEKIWEYQPRHNKKTEYAGVNIYAEKDVIITPKANLAIGKDVRVIDGKSKILLTGALTNQIDVSISEVAATGENPFESVKRRIGYVVAEGTGYTVTKSDANKLHYLSKAYDESKPASDENQPIAKATDDTSPGMWDFVLDKDNKKIVLGQRVKLIYHGNLGKIGTADKEEKLVDVYKNPNFWEGEEQLKDYKVADPSREKYDFMGWYYWKDGASAGDTESTIQDIKKPDELKSKLFDFSRVTFQNNVQDTDKIITPNVINTYAGWSENINLEVAKKWVGAKDSDKKNISVSLYDGETLKDTKTFDSSTKYGGKFKNLPVFTKSYTNNEEKNMNLRFTPKVYKVEEKTIEGFTTSYSPKTITANSNDAKKITITNKKAETGNVYVKYIAEDETVLEAESKVLENAKVGTDYTTTQKEFDGYIFSKMGEDSAEANGKVIKGDLHVIYVYKAKTSDFTIIKTVNKKEYEKAGEELTYTVTVKNTGQKKLENLVLTDSLVNITDNTFTLDVNGEKTFTYKYTVTEADVTAKKVENTASVTYGKTTKPASATSNLVEKNSAFTITKSVNKKEYEKVGEVLTFTITVKNTGEKDLTNLKLTDALVGVNGETFDLSLKEKTKTLTYKYTVTENDTKAKSILNVATVKDEVNNKEARAEATSKLRHPQPEPQPPIIPQVPDYRSLIPFIFGSGEAYVPSEKILLNKDDHKAYMFGYPDWTFRPNNNMTRAEVTVMFARLLKNYPPTDVKYNLPYRDIFESDWYYPAIGFMTENGIIKGYEDGTFRPNSPITRAEFATIAAKFEELVGIEDRSFDDVPLNHWALVYINSAYARGWVSGYEDGSFRPDRLITRAEVVTVTNKMLNRYADKDFVRNHKYELIDFKDLDEGHWAYFNIMEATHGHDYTRRPNNIDELWHRLNGEAFIFPELRYENR